LDFWMRRPFGCRAWRLPVLGEVPVQLIQALPYVLTVVLLAGFIGKAVAPQALGKPYLKSARALEHHSARAP